jgi:hypothetical protein
MSFYMLYAISIRVFRHFGLEKLMDIAWFVLEIKGVTTEAQSAQSAQRKLWIGHAERSKESHIHAARQDIPRCAWNNNLCVSLCALGASVVHPNPTPL